MSEIDDSFDEAFADLYRLDLAPAFTYGELTFTAVPAFRDPGQREHEVRWSDNGGLDIETLVSQFRGQIPEVGEYIDQVATGERRKVERIERTPADPVIFIRLGAAFTPST